MPTLDLLLLLLKHVKKCVCVTRKHMTFHSPHIFHAISKNTSDTPGEIISRIYESGWGGGGPGQTMAYMCGPARARMYLARLRQVRVDGNYPQG